MDYKPFLVFIESDHVFKSMFESFILDPCCLFDYVPNQLLVGKFGRLRPRKGLERSFKEGNLSLGTMIA